LTREPGAPIKGWFGDVLRYGIRHLRKTGEDGKKINRGGNFSPKPMALAIPSESLLFTRALSPYQSKCRWNQPPTQGCDRFSWGTIRGVDTEFGTGSTRCRVGRASRQDNARKDREWLISTSSKRQA
jgi:hypothetical protein